MSRLINVDMKPIGFSNIREADRLRKIYFLTRDLSGDFASLPKVAGNNKKGCLSDLLND